MVCVRRIGGLEYIMHSDDHEPIHLHVRCGDDEAIFRIKDGNVTYYKDEGLSNRHVRDAQEEIEDNIDFYIDKWNEIHN